MIYTVLLIVFITAGTGFSLQAYLTGSVARRKRAHSLAGLLLTSAAAVSLFGDSPGYAAIWLILGMSQLIQSVQAESVAAAEAKAKRVEAKRRRAAERRRREQELADTDRIAAEFDLPPMPRTDSPRTKP